MKAEFDRVDERFDQVDQKFDKVNGEFTAVRLEMKAGFDAMQRSMTRFFAGTLGSIIAGVVVHRLPVALLCERRRI